MTPDAGLDPGVSGPALARNLATFTPAAAPAAAGALPNRRNLHKWRQPVRPSSFGVGIVRG
jgi:hypothetical protein